MELAATFSKGLQRKALLWLSGCDCKPDRRSHQEEVDE
jgi:hypothetical protein